MASSSLSTDQFLDALSRELAAGREFEVLLETERAELLGGHADQLLALVARKTELARRAAECSSVRRQLLADAAFAPGRAGVELACTAIGVPGRRLLEELTACARHIHDLLHHNDLLVSLRLQQVGAALALLNQDQPEAPTYSPDGRSRLGAQRAERAKA
jgi:flagellar biosynthesis/type III secretory pathway chaperone